MFCAHGQQGSCKAVLKTQSWTEYLSKTELGMSLTGLAAGTRILIVNEACYSGSWTTLSPDLHGKHVLVEAASPIRGLSCNHRSASRVARCSLFGAAFVQELSVSPEGRIREHTTRIASEISHVQAGQLTSAHTFSAGSHMLWSFNISHFILTPSIAVAIHNVASRQARHEQNLVASISSDVIETVISSTPPSSSDNQLVRSSPSPRRATPPIPRRDRCWIGTEAGLMTAYQFALADDSPSDL